MSILAEEELILPWEAVFSKATKEDYFRDSRCFLEYGGFVDPLKIHHKPGPKFAVDLERREVEMGMREMIGQLQRDNPRARSLVLQFVRKLNERIDGGEIGVSETLNRLKPIKLAFELNEILVPWKKYGRLIHRGKPRARSCGILGYGEVFYGQEGKDQRSLRPGPAGLGG